MLDGMRTDGVAEPVCAALERLRDRVSEIVGGDAPSCSVCLEHVGIDAVRLMGCCFGVVCAGCLPQIPLNDGQRLCPLCRERLTTSAVVSDSSSSSEMKKNLGKAFLFESR